MLQKAGPVKLIMSRETLKAFELKKKYSENYKHVLE